MSDTTTDNKPVNGAALKGAIEGVKGQVQRKPKSWSSVTLENFDNIRVGDKIQGGQFYEYVVAADLYAIQTTNGYGGYTYHKMINSILRNTYRHYQAIMETNEGLVYGLENGMVVQEPGSNGSQLMVVSRFSTGGTYQFIGALAYDFINGGKIKQYGNFDDSGSLSDSIKEYRLSRVWPEMTENQLKQSDFTKFKPGDIIDMGAPWVVVYSDNVELQLQFGLKLWRYVKNGSSCEIIRRMAVLQEDSL